MEIPRLQDDPTEVGFSEYKSMCAYGVYLAPGAKKWENLQQGGEHEFPKPAGTVRLVCISDTHNEHNSLDVPTGDVLVHAGDIMTESGLRYTEEGINGSIEGVNRAGETLLVNFAQWIATLPHKHKVVIAGNHDKVLQGLGKERVQEVFNRFATNVHYLCHEYIDLDDCGGLRVFGSPYGHWGSHNDAFKDPSPDYSGVPHGTHVVITHKPCMLPRKGGLSEDHTISDMLHKVGAQLHVSGHCHWAHGLYKTSGGVPCVIASVCAGHWTAWKDLVCADGTTRGDIRGDKMRGGYNLRYPPVVADVIVDKQLVFEKKL